MRSGLLLSMVWIAGCVSPWTDVSRPEDAPTATVLTPSDGALVAAGRVELRGRVHDEDDTADHLFVVWSVGTDAETAWTDVCSGFAVEDGSTLCVAEVDPTITRVRLLVKDVAGFQRVVTQSIVVRSVIAPTVTLTSPVGPGPFYSDVPIVLDAVVGDEDGGADALELGWSSDLTGPVDGPTLPDPEGRLRGETLLPEGTHTVTLTARDEDGQLTRASSVIQVGPANEAPYVRIDAPTTGLAIADGQPVDLAGVALDSVTPAESLDVTWSSDRDGQLGAPVPGPVGSVGLAGVVLSLGDHQLQLRAVDDAAAESIATVQVIVDTPPTLALSAPADASTLSWPAPLRVVADLSDTVTPWTDLRLVVRSDLSGQLVDLGADADGHVAAEVVVPLGTHVLTFTAVDGYGLVTEQTRTVNVTSP